MTIEHEIHVRIVVDDTGYRMTYAICQKQIIAVSTSTASEIKKKAELAAKLFGSHYCTMARVANGDQQRRHTQ